MKISKRSQYGLRGLIQLSKTEEFLSVSSVAEKEDISADFLEKIFSDLEKEGLVKSKKGPKGGFELAKPAEKVTLWNVLETLEQTMTLVECVGDECSREKGCPAAPAWKAVAESLNKKLKSITLKDLIEETYE